MARAEHLDSRPGDHGGVVCAQLRGRVDELDGGVAAGGEEAFEAGFRGECQLVILGK